MNKETLFVSFSGGRTSAYMCWYLIENWSWKYNFIFVFANTGQEHEMTLKFADQCDKAFGLNLVWIEAVVNPAKGKGTRHKIVTFETAARNGEPFEAVISKYGIPNPDYLHCNRELKINPMKSYRRSIGFKSNHKRALGYRVDEIDRMNFDELAEGTVIYPLIKDHPTTKGEVIAWWKKQPFDLQIPEHLGNCVTCWKKSIRKLKTVAKHEPERFNFFNRMEENYSLAGSAKFDSNSEQIPRKFFRKYLSSKDIIASSLEDFNEFVDDNFNTFEDDDIEHACGEGCDF